MCMRRRLAHVRPQCTRDLREIMKIRSESHSADSIFYIGNCGIEILNLRSPKLRRWFGLLAASSFAAFQVEKSLDIEMR